MFSFFSNPWQPTAAATTAPSQYSSFSRGTTLPPTRPYLGSNSTTLDMSSYATGYHQTVPSGFSTTTSDTTAIKDQESKLETSYNPTQVKPIFVFENEPWYCLHAFLTSQQLLLCISITQKFAFNFLVN